jgi:oligoendopeptidase F
MAHARAFAPASLNAADFSAIEPFYRDLLGRPLASADDLEQLILDRSDLDALVAEKAANLYIATTRNTEDKNAEAAFLGFVRDVEPKLKPIASELDKKIATSAFADALHKARYEVLLRGMRVDIELFREANIPLETELAELEQKYNQIIGRMTVEFEGKPAFAAPLPPSLLRFQRRETYRVVLSSSAVRARVVMPGQSTEASAVVDLDAQGKGEQAW